MLPQDRFHWLNSQGESLRAKRPQNASPEAETRAEIDSEIPAGFTQLPPEEREKETRPGRTKSSESLAESALEC